MPTFLSCAYHHLDDLSHVTSAQVCMSVKVERCLLNCNAWEEEQKVYRGDMQTVRYGRASAMFEDGEEHSLQREQHAPRS